MQNLCFPVVEAYFIHCSEMASSQSGHSHYPLNHPFQLASQNGCHMQHSTPTARDNFHSRFFLEFTLAVVVWLTLLAISNCQKTFNMCSKAHRCSVSLPRD